MKKLLAVFLALMMILSVSLMACKKDEAPNTDDEVEDDDDFIVNKNNKDTTDTGDDNNDDDDDAADTSKGGNVSSAWVDKTGTVYVRADGINVRSEARTTTDKNIIGTANLGDSYSYSKYNDAWYQITYENSTAYISATYVTENHNVVDFIEPTTQEHGVAAGEAIYLVEGLQTALRCDPVNDGNDSKSTYKGSLTSAITAGGTLKILLINKAEQWAKVSFTGTCGDGHTWNGTETLYISLTNIQGFSSSSSSGNTGRG